MKSIVLYAIIGTSAIAVGAGAGVIYKRVIMDPKEEIVGFNPDICKADIDALTTEVSSFKTKDEAIVKMVPVNIANYATESYKLCENSVSICEGLAKTVVDQEIRNAQIKVADEYFEEAISKSSMVGIGKRMYQTGVDGKLSLHSDKSASDVTIQGDTVHTEYSKKEDLTPDEYKKLYGRKLPDMFIYCVHELTVIKEKCSTEKVENGDYKVILELDPKMGGFQYRYQMQTISGLDALPVFEYITLTYTLDENFSLKQLVAHEKYKATMMGISPDIENTLTYSYFPNIKWKIPEINEDVDYASIKEMIK